MTQLLQYTWGLLLLFLTLLFTNCERVVVTAPLEVDAEPNGVQFLESNQDLTTFKEVIQGTALETAIEGQRPFTAFAPTDAAFNELLSSNADWSTVEDIPNDVLNTILDYHFFDGSVLLRDTFTTYIATNAMTKFDERASLFVKSLGSVRLNGARAVALADVRVSNGIFHLLDEVLIPPTVAELIQANPNLSSLSEALERPNFSTDFLALLAEDAVFTVFAPSDTAFLNLLNANDSWQSLDDVPTEILEKILTFHVSTTDNLRTNDLTNSLEVATLLSGQSIEVGATGNVRILSSGNNTATLITGNAQGTNGVVHVIDGVLLPD
ncbi:MAG: fasciclin domain-containing protein [Bacteroidota bacterium]